MANSSQSQRSRSICSCYQFVRAVFVWSKHSQTFFQLNIVNEKMYEVLGQIYDEMFEIFEPDVFHFGGDEVKFIW